MVKKKKETPPPYLKLPPHVIEAITSAYEIDPSDLRDIGGFRSYNPHIQFLRPRAASRGPRSLASDGAWPYRLGMFHWVNASVDIKVAEAMCDLNCLRCPRIQALHCASQNRAAAATDNFPVPTE